MKYFLLLLLLVFCISPVFAQDALLIAGIIIGLLLVAAVIVVLVIVLGKKKGKKVKMSQRAANFTRLISIITKDSGIKDELVIAIVKHIVRDFVDNPNADVTDFLYKDNENMKVYLKSRGMPEFDALIFVDIVRAHNDEIMNV